MKNKGGKYMPVHFCGTYPNKNHHGYHCIGDYTKTAPKLEKVIIDKLSCTIEIDSLSERENLKKGFKELSDNDHCIPITKNGYRQAYKCFIKDDPDFGTHGQESLILQFDPKDHTHKYLRVEFNPTKAKLSAVKGILDRIITNGFNRIINQGTVTRADFSLQVHFCDVNDLMLYYPKMRQSSFHYENGQLQTAYLGKKKGTHWIIYSKDQEIKAKNEKTYHQAFSDKEKHYPNYPITRIEYCFKPKSIKPTLEDLKTLPNPFKSLLIVENYKFKVLNLSIKNKEKRENAEEQFRFFLDSCRVRGLQQALKLIKNNHRRTKYRNIVEKAKVSWWDHQKIGDQIIPLIQVIQNTKVKPLNFHFPNIIVCN